MSIITKLEEVCLENQFLGISDQERFLRNSVLEFSTLKAVSLRNTNLGHINPDVLKTFVCGLERVNLRNCHLTTEQLDAIFKEICYTHFCYDGTLWELDIFENDVTDVDRACLGEAIGKIEKVAIQDVRTVEHPDGTDLGNIICHQLKYDYLNISSLEINVIASFIFANRILNLETLTYTSTHISTATFAQFLSKGRNVVQNLRKLTLQNCLNLKSVQPDYISNTVKSLDQFSLKSTETTRTQKMHILSAASELECLN